MSNSKSEIVDNEIRTLIEQNYQYVFAILKNNKVQLDSLAGLIMEKETLNKQEIKIWCESHHLYNHL